MLTKKRIDNKLKEYIKKHSRQGYSEAALKKVLIKHGYDEHYVDTLLKKRSEIQFIKAYAVLLSFLFVISIFLFELAPAKKQQQITAFVTGSYKVEGCCISTCQQTLKNQCDGKVIENKKCDEIEDCKVKYFQKEV